MSLLDALDKVEEELGLEPLSIECDGGCGETLTRHDESYSQKVGQCQMLMLLCPECAKDAGWLPQECEKCEKELSPMATKDSYHATFEIGEGGSVLCRKHIDEYKRK